MSDDPATSPTARGTRLAHIGIALPDFGGLQPVLQDLLGLRQVPLGDSDGARIAGFAAGEPLVELLEPADASSPIAKYLEKRGPGIHHVCFAVDDLEGTLQRCRDAGLRLIDEVPRIGAEGKRIAFLHPKSTGGILVELSEH